MPKFEVGLKLKRCDGEVENLCVGKFRCDEKVKSLKKNFGSKHGPSEVSEESGVVVGAVLIFFFVSVRMHANAMQQWKWNL
jgi:hypothetical protein